MKIELGPSGIGGYNNAVNNLKLFKSFGFNAAEVAFTYSIYLNKDQASLIGKKARELGISLSIHGQYYINLLSEDQEKIEQSKIRILKAMEIGTYLGAEYVCFHPGYYGLLKRDEALSRIKDEIHSMMDIRKDNNWTCAIAPEVTGRSSQFGDLDELLKISNITKCSLVVDFAHLYARNLGNIDYDLVFEKLLKIKKIYSQFTGIEFTEKGEKRHISLNENFIMPFAKAILKSKIPIRIICESPTPVDDSLKIQKVLKSLKSKG